MSLLRARVDVLLAAVCFGTTGTAQALGAPGASPLAVGAGRLAVGAVGLVLAARWVAGGRTGTTTDRAGLARSPAVWLGALGVAGYQLTFFLGVRLTGVAVGTVVALGSAPVVTGLLARLAGGPWPGRRWAGATALAAVGLAVLALGGAGGAAVDGTAAGIDPIGILLALAAAVSYAVYTLGTKRLIDAGTDSTRAVAAVFGVGALLLLPVFALVPVGWIGTPGGAATVLWLGLVPTTLAYVLFARGLRRLDAAETSTLTLAEPLTATLLGVVVLREAVGPATALGGALLLGGLAVLALGARRATALPAPSPSPAPSAAPSPPAQALAKDRT